MSNASRLFHVYVAEVTKATKGVCRHYEIEDNDAISDSLYHDVYDIAYEHIVAMEPKTVENDVRVAAERIAERIVPLED